MPTVKPTVPPAPAGKRLTPAEYCWADNHTMLAADAQTRDQQGWRIYFEPPPDMALFT